MIVHISPEQRSVVRFVRSMGGSCRLNLAAAHLMTQFKMDEVEATTLILKMGSEGTFLLCWDFVNDKITIGLVGFKECVKSA